MWGKCSVDLMTWFLFPKYQRNKKKTVRGETKFWQRREDLKRREGERKKLDFGDRLFPPSPPRVFMSYY